MSWLLMIVVVIVIYNAEKLPEFISKLKSEVPHLIDVSKKVSHELKEKAQTKAHNIELSKKNKSKDSDKKN